MADCHIRKIVNNTFIDKYFNELTFENLKNILYDSGAYFECFRDDVDLK